MFILINCQLKYLPKAPFCWKSHHAFHLDGQLLPMNISVYIENTIIGDYMRIIFGIVFILAAWKWSDWKNWKAYYPTYLFLTALSFISDFIMYNHSLWFYCPSPNFPNHTTVALFYAALYIRRLYFYFCPGIRHKPGGNKPNILPYG